MKLFVTCQPEAGLLTQQLCKELTSQDALTHGSWCELNSATAKDLAILTYRCQSAHHTGVLLGSYGSLDELEQAIEQGAYDTTTEALFATSTNSFRVKAVKHFCEHPHTSVDIASQIAGPLHKRLGQSYAANMKEPTLSYVVIITEKDVLFGIDAVGFELTKRPYKIFSHPASVNGVVAFTAARLAGLTAKSVVLDPFCDSATIPIEVALYKAKSSPFLFERQFIALQSAILKDAFEECEQELKELQNTFSGSVYAFEPQLKVMLQSKKNIKLANMQEHIICSKVTTDWIDAKVDERSVDILISKPPQISKRNPAVKQIKKVYDELFYQARYVLKKNGVVALFMHEPKNIEEFIEKHQFTITQTHQLHGGKQTLTLLLCKQRGK